MTDKFWTAERQARAVAEIQLGIAMAKSRGVECGRVSDIKFTEPLSPNQKE